MSDHERMLCRVCRRPLDEAEGDGFSLWLHPSYMKDADHTPDPIPASTVQDEAVNVCDFCLAPHPEWVYPCQDFTVSEALQFGSKNEWAACVACHVLIEAGEWRQLANRSLGKHDGVEPLLRAMVRESILDLHRLFNEHRSGPAYREYERH